ncbi:MAG: hypothetical protein FWH14_07320 [Oscillospiraceae bacterium]|nr:hypothetical protein [Oscillospiraceae bacterium]
MKTSAAMNEIRKIRDENSLRHLSQTPAERKQELKKSLDWFIKEIGKNTPAGFV